MTDSRHRFKCFNTKNVTAHLVKVSAAHMNVKLMTLQNINYQTYSSSFCFSIVSNVTCLHERRSKHVSLKLKEDQLASHHLVFFPFHCCVSCLLCILREQPLRTSDTFLCFFTERVTLKPFIVSSNHNDNNHGKTCHFNSSIKRKSCRLFSTDAMHSGYMFSTGALHSVPPRDTTFGHNYTAESGASPLESVIRWIKGDPEEAGSSSSKWLQYA